MMMESGNGKQNNGNLIVHRDLCDNVDGRKSYSYNTVLSALE